jgi:hypothetical protein
VAAAAGDCQAGTAFAFDSDIGLRRARLLLSVGVGLLARFAVLDLGCAISQDAYTAGATTTAQHFTRGLKQSGSAWNRLQAPGDELWRA